MSNILKGKCGYFAGCDIAKQGVIQEISNGEEFKCQNCERALIPISQEKQMLLGIGLTVILMLFFGIFIFYFFSNWRTNDSDKFYSEQVTENILDKIKQNKFSLDNDVTIKGINNISTEEKKNLLSVINSINSGFQMNLTGAASKESKEKYLKKHISNFDYGCNRAIKTIVYNDKWHELTNLPDMASLELSNKKLTIVETNVDNTTGVFCLERLIFICY